MVYGILNIGDTTVFFYVYEYVSNRGIKFCELFGPLIFGPLDLDIARGDCAIRCDPVCEKVYGF